MKEAIEIKVLFESLSKEELKRFPSQGTPNVSSSQGVYILYSVSGMVLNVGRSISADGVVNQPLNNHINGRSSFTCVYTIQRRIDLRKELLFRFIEVYDHRNRTLLEVFTFGVIMSCSFRNRSQRMVIWK